MFIGEDPIHIKTESRSDIAELVLMPGDPLRAKYIAENFLENAKLVTSVRNMFGFTGTYKGKKVTVMGSGMGMPSMGIYAFELFHFYNVKRVIRIGTCGVVSPDVKVPEIILGNLFYSESSYAKTQNGCEDNILYANDTLNFNIKQAAEENNIPITLANVHSSDVFYKEKDNYKELYEKYGCMCVEMESFALFHNAKVLNKKAACILTISDHLVKHEHTTPEERQKSFNKMIELALKSL